MYYTSGLSHCHLHQLSLLKRKSIPYRPAYTGRLLMVAVKRGSVCMGVLRCFTLPRLHHGHHLERDGKVAGSRHVKVLVLQCKKISNPWERFD